MLFGIDLYQRHLIPTLLSGTCRLFTDHYLVSEATVGVIDLLLATNALYRSNLNQCRRIINCIAFQNSAGINLRKVEERRLKTEQKQKTAVRLDVQAIMEAAFERRRKALEDNDSEKDEDDDAEDNWSDDG